MDEETIFTVCMFFKFAEYPCFSVVLAGSFHFFKEKYLFILSISDWPLVYGLTKEE